jgi:hypothetical protein
MFVAMVGHVLFVKLIVVVELFNIGLSSLGQVMGSS